MWLGQEGGKNDGYPYMRLHEILTVPILCPGGKNGTNNSVSTLHPSGAYT